MGGQRRHNEGSGFGAAFVFVVFLGLIIQYIWWIVGAVALVAACYAVRAIMRSVEARRLAEAEREAQLARRAEQQHRWTLRGDSRGVYGVTGAQAMRAVTPAPPEPDAPPGEQRIAAIARTATDLAKLRREKLPCWRWALFGSVLVQRRERLRPRLRDSALGYSTSDGERLYTRVDVAFFVGERLDELSQLVDQVEAFLSAPAFTGMFGDPGNESTADADGIVHIANRLMDYLERLLTLSEHCRSVSAPGQYADLLRDCARLADAPIQGYTTFVDEFVERVNEMPELFRFATGGTVETDPVVLELDVDHPLFRRVSQRLNALRS